ncbi:excalibur calcium-binding domain-containing protein [Streptomyces sp. HUAS 31]|uniref:excalibur calcium-binding domain-containing protein n=1 Tax=Streptomyces sp. HUAS 31 TaxID=3020055 RepID=UPI0023052DD6|nr:excalibur calcium-binding domain-containing protein [Streptomyces sp. HUAS 31]WCD96689.1 excalibur calcium-binding domain-containing protein [Streptomyces sp. HUAS 31]
MNLLRKPGAIVVAALALAALPSTAAAHDGAHPFENCAEAYANGYSDIPASDEHYASRLDRDGDGLGCDNPPAGFVPVGEGSAEEGVAEEGTASGEAADGEKQDGTDLAATGGDDSTPYLAAGGAALLAGGGVLLALRRRASR